MGVRFLNLRTTPWCFHLIGPYSCIQFQPEPPVEMIRLIKSDGLVKIYDRPIHVSDLMVEFPKHLVCRSDSFYIGQKIPALSAHDRLQLGQTYFVLPQHFFQSVLSFVTIASFTTASSKLQSRHAKNAFLKKASSCQPFDIQKSPTGCLRIRVSDEFISQLVEQGKLKESEEDGCPGIKSKSKVCTTPQLEKDYTQLVGSRLWKPKLEPLKEMEKRKLASFWMKSRKVDSLPSFSQLKGTHKTNGSFSQHHFHVPTSKTCSKMKMRIKLRKT